MGRIRTLIVDDSVVVRRLIQDVLEQDRDITVAGSANNGKEGVEKAKALRPDIITMDIEMPIMNGIDAVKALRAAGIRCPIIMFSTLTAAGANATMDALSAGASDFVTKPGNVGTIVESMAAVREDLIPKIKALTGRPDPRAGAAAPRISRPSPGRPAPSRPAPGRPASASKAAPSKPGATVPKQPKKGPIIPRALAIGSSTGGPQALGVVLKDLPRNLAVPVFITQHMPPVFTAQLAQRLDRDCPAKVVEAEHGMPVTPGTVYLAPGDYHMVVKNDRRSPLIQLNQEPPENFCRPAVDVMFRSLASQYNGSLLTVVLTGMGSDGARGCETIQSAGGYVVAQDEPSSVVWGMPGAVVKGDLHDAVLPLNQIAGHLRDRLNKAASPSPTKTTGV